MPRRSRGGRGRSQGQGQRPGFSGPAHSGIRHQSIRFASAEEDLWHRCVQHWFPELLQRAYFIPPVHMNKQHLSELLVASSFQVHVTNPPVDDQPAWLNQAVQKCHVREDQAQQRILVCLQKLAKEQREVMVVLSQLQFGDFLNNPAYAAANSMLPRPIDLNDHRKRKGDFDLVLIHRKYGLLAMEIKAVGDNFGELRLTRDEEDSLVASRLKCAVRQLNKATEVLEHLVSDHEHRPRVRCSIILPNVCVERLRRVLETFPDVNKMLCKCLGLVAGQDPVSFCVCADQLSTIDEPWKVTPAVLSSLGQWWKQRVVREGPDSAMNDTAYENLAARFCGPATTVKVFCPRGRVVHLRSEGEGVSETGKRFSQFVLLKSQVALLQHPPLLAYVTGPPGTGKTLMLFLKALEWAREPDPRRVDVLSTCNSSLAVSHLIVHLLKVHLEEPLKQNVHFHHFDLEHGGLDDAKRELLDIGKSGELCIIADEAVGNKDFLDLCNTLCDSICNLRLWAASTFHQDRPTRLTEVKLTESLRTPPVMTREVEKAGVMKDWRDVYPYTPPAAPLPTEGPGVLNVDHKGPQHTGDTAVDCEQCGKEVADVLKKLHVGHSDPPQAVRTSSDHPEHLEYRDVFLLTREENFQTRPPSALIRGLRQKRVPVRVVRPGDSQAACDVATQAGADEVIATSAQTVNGLERKVVVWVQGEKAWDDNCGRLMIVSRCTAQLVCVGRPTEEENEATETASSEPAERAETTPESSVPADDCPVPTKRRR